jgi:predicted MFS family arabinose efflux permease
VAAERRRVRIALGALAGGLLVVHVNLWLPLAMAAALLAATALVAHRLSGGDDAWARLR